MPTLYTDGTTAATIGEVEGYAYELRSATSAATVARVAAMIDADSKLAGATVAADIDEMWVRVTVPDVTTWKVAFVNLMGDTAGQGIKVSATVVRVRVDAAQKAFDRVAELL